MSGGSIEFEGDYQWYVPKKNGDLRKKIKEAHERIKNFFQADVTPDVITYVFRAFLIPEVPLHILELDGVTRQVNHAEEEIPSVPRFEFGGRTTHGGRWSEIKHRRQLEGPEDEERKKKLRYLKLWRQILKNHSDPEVIVERTEKITQAFPELESAAREFDPNPAFDYFRRKLEQLPGVGKKTARNLMFSQLKTFDVIREAGREELLDVPGIGETTAGEIMDYLEKLDRESSD